MTGPASFTVRATTMQDVPALLEFIEPFVAQGKMLPRARVELEELIAHGYVAEADGKIVGFAALEVYSPKMAELRSLAVDSNYQGRGIGKALVTACIHLARLLDVFEVMAITSSEEFFKRCGFDFSLPGERKALFLQTRNEY